MKQEQKELLLRDLCGRLPYGLKYNYGGYDGCDYTMNLVDCNAVDCAFPIENVKPYLFPMSSMTEEQYNEFFSYYHNIEMDEVEASGDYLKAAYLCDSAKYEWLNRNHFDWRYLIDKGLAIDATGLNIY